MVTMVLVHGLLLGLLLVATVPPTTGASLSTSAAAVCDAKRSFGAAGDGVTLDTVSIQRAVAACSAQHVTGQPRSKVLLTNGTFLSGPIRLLSHVELVIGAGSTLLATDDVDHWPWCKRCDAGEWPCADTGAVDDFPCIDTTAIPFITARDAVNIAITGDGYTSDASIPRPDSSGKPSPGTPVIDGRGTTWMKANFDRNTTNRTLHDLLHDHRPHVIQLFNCTDVMLSGFFVHDSPMYHLSFYRGARFEISNLVLWSPAAATSKAGYWNTDGIDIGAEFVHVHNVFVHNGDDSIIVKGRYPEDAAPSADCFGGRHVLVENCTAVAGLGMGLGTGSFTAINVTFRDIVIGDTRGGSSGGW
jgi:polygalacturonase